MVIIHIYISHTRTRERQVDCLSLVDLQCPIHSPFVNVITTATKSLTQDPLYPAMTIRNNYGSCRFVYITVLNKPARCSWVVSFISLVDCSTCFGRFLHPSSGVQLYMRPLVRVHIGQPPSYVAGYEFISCHVEAPETWRVVNK